MKLLITVFLFILSSSCANFINKMHSDLDKADQRTGKKPSRNKKSSFQRFRNPYLANQKRSLNNQNPKIKREYKNSRRVKKRYTADDLVDNQDDGSLWSGHGNNNYLFSLDQEKKNGDIVVINVFDRLKKEITMELKRATSRYRKPEPKKEEKDDSGKDKTAAAPKPAEPKKKSEGETSAYDKISAVIIEKINKNYFLIRGQKQLLFKNKKHIVEIQALMAKRDIESDDTVHSDKLLESNIYLVR